VICLMWTLGPCRTTRCTRCLDLLLPLKEELFGHLRQRCATCSCDVIRFYSTILTSTYFELRGARQRGGPRRFGYSRGQTRGLCPGGGALVVTPEGLPLAYEMFPGNTADKTTLRGMLETIQRRFGKAERIWIMDRGIPPRRFSPSCAPLTRRCGTSSVRPKAASRNWSRTLAQLRGAKFGRSCG